MIESNSESQLFFSHSLSLTFLHSTVQFDVVLRLHDFRRKQHTNFCGQHVQNLHVLVSVDLWGFWGFILALGTFAHLHGALIGSLSSPVGPDPCSQCSLDLRAQGSAPLVSRLLRIVHKVGFCEFHFFAQIYLEDVPCQLTNLSKCILIAWPIFLFTGIMKPPSDPK